MHNLIRTSFAIAAAITVIGFGGGSAHAQNINPTITQQSGKAQQDATKSAIDAERKMKEDEEKRKAEAQKAAQDAAKGK